MATKSILKNVTIRNRKNAEMLVNALEHAQNKGAQEVNAPAPFYPDKEAIRKMVFAKK